MVASLLGGAIVVATPAVAHTAEHEAPAARVTNEPDTVSAAMSARKQRKPVEILADRTDTSQTFANPNGTLTYQVSVQPRWVNKSGSWVSVDANLQQNSDGSWSPKAAESGLKLSGGGSAPLAVQSFDGQSLSVSWPTALPKPTVSGASATYANVLAGVNLVVNSTVTGGFDETLVVENARAAKDPGLADLQLTLSTSKGLTAHQEKSGAVLFENAKGKVVFASPAPLAWDSAGGASSATHASANAHRASVGVTFTSGHERLSVPASLLSGSKTVYPAYLDPSYGATQTSESYDEVQSAYPTGDELDATSDGGVSVGWDGGSIDRGYFNFGLPPAADGSVSQVLSASVSTKVSKVFWSSSTSHTIDVYETDPATASTTWNAQATQLAGPQALTFTTDSYTPNQTETINVASWLQPILQASGSDLTLGLVNSNESETNTSQFAEFSGSATLSMTYDLAPYSVKATTLSPVAWASNGAEYTSSATPTFSATTSSPEDDSLSYQFAVYSGTTQVESGTSASVASGATGTWKATTALTNGDTYTVESRAYDGTEYSAWSPTTSFTVDTGIPAAPSVTCSGYTKGVWNTLASSGVTCTVSDSTSDIDGYSYGVADGSADVSWQWSTSKSFTIDPTATGLYTLKVFALTDAGLESAEEDYVFGVGPAAMLSPADGSQTSGPLYLQAAAPAGYSEVTFDYRVGNSGSFAQVPSQAVFACGCTGQWPAPTVTNAAGVQSAVLTWDMTKSLADDGPVQVEAVFSNPAGATVTSSPVTTTLDRLGTGVDFGTTSVGPVTVGLQSGDASVSAGDVSISSFDSGLEVTRTFNSLTPSTPSIFGPGWTSSLPAVGTGDSWSSITDNGSYVLLTGADGSTLSFTPGDTSSGATSYDPQGSAITSGLTLTKTGSTFTLVDSSNTVITFVSPAGGTSAQYLPSGVTQPGNTGSTTYVYDGTSTDSTYGDLMQIVAPDPNAPAGTASSSACPYPATSANWGAGCRGLDLSYDPTSRNVSEVDFLSSNGTTLTRTPVAEYSYDSSGRLVSEWDPRISPALKTTYTYDETSTDSDFGRLTQISPAQSTAGSLAPWILAYNDTTNSADYGKLVSVSRSHNTANGGGTATNQVLYSVPLTTAAGGPANMDAATTATWGQSDDPVSAVAIFPADHAPGSGTITDWTYATIDYYDAQGHEVNSATYNNGWDVTTTEYDQYGNDIRELTADNRATALAAGANSVAVSRQLDTENLYSADGTQLLDTYGPTHQASAAGSVQTIRTHTHNVYDTGAPNGDVDAAGGPYNLETSTTVSASLGATVPGSSDVDGRTTEYVYNNGSDNEGWILGTPLQTITDPGTGHLDIAKTVSFNESTSLYGGTALQISSSQPSDTAGTGAGTTDTVYYTAGSNPVDAACGDEPVWTDLVCKTESAAQPSTAGLASVAVTLYTYNIYLAPLTTTQTYTAADGSTATRTTTLSYDAAGRTTGSTVTTTGSGMGTPVAPTAIVYDPKTGLQSDTQSLNSSGGVAQDLYSTYDDWGQQTSYTDASGHVTYYSYDLAGDTTGVSDTGDTTSYSFDGGNNHSGQISSETDSLAGDFGVTYDADGNLSTESYPGGTVASYTFDSTDQATALTYTNSGWSGSLSDTVTSNAAGDWTNQTVLDSSQAYSYDAADRLTGVADTENGQCTTRGYTYDSDSNRLSASSDAPNSNGSCQDTTADTDESYTYDGADRLTNAGYTYDTQGDITTTPSVDAGGVGNLTASYFADNMIASQSQAGDTQSMALDPLGNRISSYTDSASGTTTTSDYADGSDSPVLTTSSAGGWVRNISGPSGLLAEVTPTGTTLQLVDLHGDVMATEVPGASDVGPTATYTYNEFGAPESTTPAAPGWLGNDESSVNALGGTVLLGARVYNPADGRFAQTDPVPGGSANTYDYGNQNPVNNSDPTGTASWGHKSCGWWTCTFYFNKYETNRFEYYYNRYSGEIQFLMPVIGAAIGGLLCAEGMFAAGACAAVAAILFLSLLWNVVDTLNWISNHGGCFSVKTSLKIPWGHYHFYVPYYTEESRC